MSAGVSVKSSFSELPRDIPRRRELKQDHKRLKRSFEETDGSVNDDEEINGNQSPSCIFESDFSFDNKFELDGQCDPPNTNGAYSLTNIFEDTADPCNSGELISKYFSLRDSLTDTQLERYVNSSSVEQKQREDLQ